MFEEMPPDGGTDGRTAAGVMTASPRTCSPFSTIVEAALIFRDADCGAVPVLNEGKRSESSQIAISPWPWRDIPTCKAWQSPKS